MEYLQFENIFKAFYNFTGFESLSAIVIHFLLFRRGWLVNITLVVSKILEKSVFHNVRLPFYHFVNANMKIADDLAHSNVERITRARTFLYTRWNMHNFFWEHCNTFSKHKVLSQKFCQMVLSQRIVSLVVCLYAERYIAIWMWVDRWSFSFERPRCIGDTHPNTNKYFSLIVYNILSIPPIHLNCQ